ncbi:GNAT family N-acetyltransferase [Candidatus Woesebacteria bacterium]|nr:GNAT family N-acetyltransferase [Candidatus Woesebacteria bacterium]
MTAISLPLRFTTKKNRTVTIRLLTLEDSEQSREYINQISAEDTFIGFSGEQLTADQELDYIKESIASMNEGNSLHLVAEFEGKIVAMCDARRDMSLKKRSAHIAQFGLTVTREFRGEGLGEAILKLTIDILPTYITNIRLLKLSTFGPNEVALALYQKLGFQQYGVLSGGIFFHDQFVDHILMSRPL